MSSDTLAVSSADARMICRTNVASFNFYPSVDCANAQFRIVRFQESRSFLRCLVLSIRSLGQQTQAESM